MTAEEISAAHLDSLNGRSVDRRQAADHARDTLQRWELTR